MSFIWVSNKSFQQQHGDRKNGRRPIDCQLRGGLGQRWQVDGKVLTVGCITYCWWGIHDVLWTWGETHKIQNDAENIIFSPSGQIQIICPQKAINTVQILTICSNTLKCGGFKMIALALSTNNGRTLHKSSCAKELQKESESLQALNLPQRSSFASSMTRAFFYSNISASAFQGCAKHLLTAYYLKVNGWNSEPAHIKTCMFTNMAVNERDGETVAETTMKRVGEWRMCWREESDSL